MATENPLGRQVPVAERYSPQLLFPIERWPARRELGLSAGELPFRGEDLWRAWEISWLDGNGKPQVRVGRFRIPCHSPCLVESKSLKLYLNSLNQESFPDEQAVRRVLETDLGAVAGAAVEVELLALDSGVLQPRGIDGTCVDELEATPMGEQPAAALLDAGQQQVEEVLYTHLMRSLCPVTAQPDWATVIVSYSGRRILPQSLLAYILSYRRHQAFHEPCVERIFCDLLTACQPAKLSVQALYTRRGGLDINPFRSTMESRSPGLRSVRQ